jgi:hypothetical protein
MSTEPDRPDGIEEQLRNLNGSVDRLLILAMDHAQAIDEVKVDVRDVKADIREIRREVAGVHEAFTEHLGWHLGRGGAA